MAQAPMTVAGGPGLNVRNAINNAHHALASHHKGSAAPSYAAAGMIWCDDSGDPIWRFKVYDGGTWIEDFALDTTNNRITMTPYGMTVAGPFASRGIQDDALFKRLLITDFTTKIANQAIVEFQSSTAGDPITKDSPYHGLIVRPAFTGAVNARSSLVLTPQCGANYGAVNFTAIPDGGTPGAKLSVGISRPGNTTNQVERLVLDGPGVSVTAHTTDTSSIDYAGSAPWLGLQVKSQKIPDTSQTGIGFSITSGANHAGAAIVVQPGGATPGTEMRFLTNPAGSVAALELGWRITSAGHLLPGGVARNIGGNNSSDRVDTIYVKTGGVVEVSDERTKTDIAPIDGEAALAFVKALQPKTFRVREKGVRHSVPLTAEEYRAIRAKELENSKLVLEPHQQANRLDADVDAYRQGRIGPFEKVVETIEEGKRTHSGLMTQDVAIALEAADQHVPDMAMLTLSDPDDPDSEQGERPQQIIAWLARALQVALERIEALEAQQSATS